MHLNYHSHVLLCHLMTEGHLWAHQSRWELAVELVSPGREEYFIITTVLNCWSMVVVTSRKSDQFLVSFIIVSKSLHTTHSFTASTRDSLCLPSTSERFWMSCCILWSAYWPRHRCGDNSCPARGRSVEDSSHRKVFPDHGCCFGNPLLCI